MIFIVVRHLVRPEYAEEFPRLVEDFTAASRAEPGTISFEWSRSTDDPSVYFLVEAFRDAAAGQAHVESGHFKATIARTVQSAQLCYLCAARKNNDETMTGSTAARFQLCGISASTRSLSRSRSEAMSR